MHHPARRTTQALLTGSLAGLVACAGGADHGASPPDTAPSADRFLASDVTEMGGDLMRVRVVMTAGTDRPALEDYARCVMAGYAHKNKAGFLRLVRMLTDKEGGVSRADAVYSVTSALPAGMKTLDAEVTVDDCLSRAIPTEMTGRV